jgi:hypothetical protein
VNAIAVGGVLASLLLLQKFKLKIIPVVLLSAAFGLPRYFLSHVGF